MMQRQPDNLASSFIPMSAMFGLLQVVEAVGAILGELRKVTDLTGTFEDILYRCVKAFFQESRTGSEHNAAHSWEKCVTSY